MSYHTDRRVEHPDRHEVDRLVRRALEEDVGEGDLTAALIPAASHCTAELVVREDAILCGQAWFNAVYHLLDPSVSVHWHASDGEALRGGQVVCRVSGIARSVNSGERVALNLLQTLSGTATVTRRYVEHLRGTQTEILDTRKTIPGLRRAQKYAVRCGGGRNHRIGLFDAMLIKENHITAAGGVTNAVLAARRAHPDAPLELEVETLQQLDEALSLGVTMIMLDNFDEPLIREAVARTRGRAQLEVSGNVTEDNLAHLASTGVDYISVGALTKHLRSVDFSMRVLVEQS